MANRSKNWKKKIDKQASDRNFQDAEALQLDAKKDRSYKGKGKPQFSKQRKNSFGNHFSWYNKIPQLVNDSASISSATMAGVPFQLHAKGSNTLELHDAQNTRYRIDPGMFTLSWHPATGRVDDTNPATTAINVSALSLVSYIMKGNSRDWSYDASDMMMYILAASDAYAYLATMRRLYGRLTPFSAIDRSTPETIFSALGGDYSDLSTNAANFRAYINIYAQKLGQLALPAGLGYHERHMWMNESLFCDSTHSPKVQYYAYTQAAYFRYTERTADGPGELRLVTPSHTQNGKKWDYIMGDYWTNLAAFGQPGSGLTLNEIIKFGDSLLNPLLWSEDISKMSADIIKAMPNLYKVNLIDENYTIPAVYDAEVASQFENFYAYTPNWGDQIPLWPVGKVQQNSHVGKGYVYDNMALMAAMPEGKDDTDVAKNLNYQLIEVLINAHVDTMSPEFIMKATRAKCYDCRVYSKPDETATDISGIWKQFNKPNTAQPPIENKGWVGYTYGIYGSEVIYRMSAWFKTPITPNRYLSIVGNTIMNTINMPTNGTTAYARSVVEGALDMILLPQSYDWHPCVNVNILFNSGSEKEEYFPVPYLGIDLDNYTTMDTRTLAKIHNTALLSEFMFEGIGNYGLR